MEIRETHGLGREALVYTMAKLLQGAIGFVAMYLFTRLLLPEEYGYYWLVIAGVELTTMFACSWINQTLKRYHPETTATEMPRFMGRIAGAYAVTFSLLIILAGLTSLLLPLFNQPSSTPWLVLLVSIPVAGIIFIQWLFRIHRRPWDFLIASLIAMGGRLLLGWILLVHMERTGFWLLIAYVISATVATAWGLLRLREHWLISRESFSWQSIRDLLGYGFPITIANGSLSLMNSGGRLILGLLAGKAAVGVFAAVAQLMRQLMELAVSPIQIGADPLTMRVHKHDGSQAAANYMKHWLGLVLMMGSGVSLSLYLLRHAVVGALLDPQYASGAHLLGMLAPAMVFFLCLVVAMKSFELSENTKMLAGYFVAAGALNVFLNFALIPLLDERGAALALLLSYAAVAIISYIGGQRLFPWKLPWKMVLLLLVPLTSLVLIHGALSYPTGLLSTFSYGVGYVLLFLAVTTLMLWLCRNVMRDEIRFLKQVVSARNSN